MILECDIGNTHAKWRVLDKDNGVVACSNSTKWQCDNISLPGLPIKKIRALSVAGDNAKSMLSSAASNTYGMQVVWAKTEPHAAGVTCAYKEPSKLGVDRWAAVVAAYNKSQSAVLVVDAGSAITVDAVDAEGYHLGGYIAPGSALMKYALETKTSGVRFAENFVQGNKGFGGSTDSAVQAGIFAAQLGMVEVALQEAKKVLGEYNLYLTGGGALALHNQLSTVGFHEPDLVLDGLAWLIP